VNTFWTVVSLQLHCRTTTWKPIQFVPALMWPDTVWWQAAPTCTGFRLAQAQAAISQLGIGGKLRFDTGRLGNHNELGRRVADYIKKKNELKLGSTTHMHQLVGLDHQQIYVCVCACACAVANLGCKIRGHIFLLFFLPSLFSFKNIPMYNIKLVSLNLLPRSYQDHQCSVVHRTECFIKALVH